MAKLRKNDTGDHDPLTFGAFFLIFLYGQDVPEPVPVSPIAHLEDRKQAIYEICAICSSNTASANCPIPTISRPNNRCKKNWR